MWCILINIETSKERNTASDVYQQVKQRLAGYGVGKKAFSLPPDLEPVTKVSKRRGKGRGKSGKAGKGRGRGKRRGTGKGQGRGGSRGTGKGRGRGKGVGGKSDRQLREEMSNMFASEHLEEGDILKNKNDPNTQVVFALDLIGTKKFRGYSLNDDGGILCDIYYFILFIFII